MAGERCGDCEHFSEGGWGGRDNWNDPKCRWTPDWPEWLVEAVIKEARRNVYIEGGWGCPQFKRRDEK